MSIYTFYKAINPLMHLKFICHLLCDQPCWSLRVFCFKDTWRPPGTPKFREETESRQHKVWPTRSCRWGEAQGGSDHGESCVDENGNNEEKQRAVTWQQHPGGYGRSEEGSYTQPPCTWPSGSSSRCTNMELCRRWDHVKVIHLTVCGPDLHLCIMSCI